MLFTFPSRYYALSVAKEYLALEGGPPSFPRGFPGPVVLRIHPRPAMLFAYRAFTFSGGPFQTLRLSTLDRLRIRSSGLGVLQPLARNACGLGTGKVWALPLSLAATEGISVDFFSSGY